MSNKIALNLFYGCIAALLLTGCTDPKEGCLDINASNYQVDADRACSDCCEYPSLRFELLHKVRPPSDANLVLEDSVYQDGAGNDFRISEVRFYISNAVLLRPDGMAVPVTDTLQLPVEQADGSTEIEIFTDDFALVNAGNIRPLTIGTFVSEGSFSSLRFDLGIGGTVNKIDPLFFPENHPLSEEDMFWNSDSGRVFNRLELFRIEGQSDTTYTSLEIGFPENLQTVELPLPVPFELNPGFGPRLVLRINYLSWFEGVDLIADDQATLIQKIVNNLTKAFSVTEIEQELE